MNDSVLASIEKMIEMSFKGSLFESKENVTKTYFRYNSNEWQISKFKETNTKISKQ